MNCPRITESQSASPATGIRNRVGNVIRWHAEPITSDDSAEIPDVRESRDSRTAQPASQAL